MHTMPTYVYEVIDDTVAAPRRFEVDQRMSAPALTHDPVSGLPVRRVISGGLGFIGAAEPDTVPCASGGCMVPRQAPVGCGHAGPCHH
jgi:hypothetical protein